jgi:hypothetical protein
MGLSMLAANRRRDRRLIRRGKGEVRRHRLVRVLILGGEDGLEVLNKSGSKLVRGSGLRAIQIDKMGDTIFSIPFNNGVVEESGVAVTMDDPILFSSLEVINFPFGKEVMMLLGEIELKHVILLVRWLGLLVQKLIHNSSKVIRIPRLTLSPLT